MGFTHPQILVIGEHYPLPPVRAFLSKIISMAQFGLIGIGIGGGFIPAIRNHALYQQFQQNKMMIFLAGYFGLNMLSNSVSSTGAFEVYFNDRIIFSKLSTNRMPTL